MELINAETFITAQQQTFLVDLGNQQEIPLVLIEVKIFDQQPGLNRQPFSLLFSGPKQPVLSQATYRFVHQELGQLDIFIVPVGQDAQSVTYQAIYS